jgi:hypothetical protein
MSLTEKEAIREWKSLQKLQPTQWMERINSLP